MKNISTSKSSTIRDIENKYGINMTTCTRSQLDALTSSSSRLKVITKLDDLMINARQFDLDNMTDIEKANLKYLVMSTDELLSLLAKKARSIYYKPRETRLRRRMTYNDFYQICAYKLLLNDGILRFNGNYKLDPAMHLWLLRTAMWQSYESVNHQDELYILDKPCNDDNESTLGDILLKDNSYCDEYYSIDADKRIEWILSQMDKTNSRRIVFKVNDTLVPYSEYTLAKLFIKYNLGKKELSKMMYNTSNNKLVSNQIFNKFYKQTLMHIADLLNKEANECGESFNIDEDLL
jgi:hypothetical protein